MYLMKWVTEQNPTASYKEISNMYKDLSRALEANQQELSRVVAIHKNLSNQFPSNFILSGKEPLKYKPISSDKTDEVLRTGKDNEVVVCIGLDENNNLQWVRSFSWTNNKRVNVEFREEIMELKTLDYNKLYDITNKTITCYYKKKNFHDYDYISVEPNKTEFIVCLIITLIVTFGTNYYCYHNEFEN